MQFLAMLGLTDPHWGHFIGFPAVGGRKHMK
jgi:hypothetical protein